jgi:membrane-bound metal-dependent hydrolase YbcI (DUF457 family)
MPSPVVHLTIGYTIYRALQHNAHTIRKLCTSRFARWIVLAACLFFSLIPDADSALGVLASDFGAYHNQWSHSLFFGITPAIFFTLAARLFVPWRAALRWGALCLISCVIHVLLDYACYGRGVKLFWPFSNERFISPVLLFYGLQWSEGFFSMHHLQTLINEGLYALVILPPVIYFTQTHNRNVSHDSHSHFGTWPCKRGGPRSSSGRKI